MVTEVRETPCDWHGKNLEEACWFSLKLSKSNRNVFFFSRMCRSISFYSPSLCSSPNHYVGRGTTVQWAAPCVVTETGRNKLKREKKDAKNVSKPGKIQENCDFGRKTGRGQWKTGLRPGRIGVTCMDWPHKIEQQRNMIFTNFDEKCRLWNTSGEYGPRRTFCSFGSCLIGGTWAHCW